MERHLWTKNPHKFFLKNSKSIFFYRLKQFRKKFPGKNNGGFFVHKRRSTIFPVCGFFVHILQIGVNNCIFSEDMKYIIHRLPSVYETEIYLFLYSY